MNLWPYTRYSGDGSATRPPGAGYSGAEGAGCGKQPQ